MQDRRSDEKKSIRVRGDTVEVDHARLDSTRLLVLVASRWVLRHSRVEGRDEVVSSVDGKWTKKRRSKSKVENGVEDVSDCRAMMHEPLPVEERWEEGRDGDRFVLRDVGEIEKNHSSVDLLHC